MTQENHKHQKKISIDTKVITFKPEKSERQVSKLFRISNINYQKISQLDRMIKESNKKFKTQMEENQSNKYTSTLELYDKIHLGNFSSVYKVRNIDSGKHYALKKVIKDKKYQSREEKICKVVKNNFIVEIVDVYKSQVLKQTEYNILMKLYPWTLKQFLESTPQIDRTILQVILYQIARAVHYMHVKGICHRDITPSNFMMNTSGRIYLGDFGSAKFLNKNEKSVCYLNMRPYRAPQLLIGSQFYTNSIDVWSIGCIALQILTGRQVFNGKSTLDALLNIGRYLGTKDFKKTAGDSELIQNLPTIKGRGLQQLIRTEDKSIIDLLRKILCIDSQKRIPAIGILAHSFFDTLRDEQTFIELSRKNIDISDFFEFTAIQMFGYEQYYNKLVPIWKRDRPDKHASKAN